jgi:hypothetical protein
LKEQRWIGLLADEGVVKQHRLLQVGGRLLLVTGRAVCLSACRKHLRAVGDRQLRRRQRLGTGNDALLGGNRAIAIDARRDRIAGLLGALGQSAFKRRKYNSGQEDSVQQTNWIRHGVETPKRFPTSTIRSGRSKA